MIRYRPFMQICPFVVRRNHRLLTTMDVVPLHVLKYESLRRGTGSTEHFGASVVCVPLNEEIVEEVRWHLRRQSALARRRTPRLRKPEQGIPPFPLSSRRKRLVFGQYPDTSPKISHSHLIIPLGPQVPSDSFPIAPQPAYRMFLRASFCWAVNDVGNLTLYLMMKLPLWPGFFEMGMPWPG